MGLPQNYRLVGGELAELVNRSVGENEKPVRKKRHLSAKGRKAIADAARRRWAKQKLKPSKSTAQVSEILEFARANADTLDSAAYKAAHPNKGLRSIGAMIRNDFLRKTKTKGVFKIGKRGIEAAA